jgi:hypothetical protein
VHKLQDDNARLTEALAAKDRDHAEQLAELKRQADRDALLGSLGRFQTASSVAALPWLAQELR